MEELMKEYGSLILGIFAALAVAGIAAKILLPGGILGELLMQLGTMAC